MTRIHGSFVLLGAVAAAVLVTGCQKQADSASDPAAVTKAIKADEKKWNDDFKSKNLEGLLSHYSDDAFFVAPGVTANGSTEIRKAYADALSDNYFEVTFASDKIDASGDLAYARGHFSEKYQDRKSLKIISDSGSYLTVYKKQDDGSWKAIEDVAAADPATRKETDATATPAKMISM